MQNSLLAVLGFATDAFTGERRLQAGVFDRKNGDLLQTAQPFSAGVDRVAPIGDSKLLAIAGSDWSETTDSALVWIRNSSVKIVDIDSGATVAQLKHPGYVSRLLVMPEHGLLATGCADGIVRLWNPVNGELVGRLIGHNRLVCSLCWLPERNMLASGDAEGLIRTWTLDDSPVRYQMTLAWRNFGALRAMTIDRRTGDILTGHKGAVSAISLSRDGRRLATTCGKHLEIRIWELPGEFAAADARPRLIHEATPDYYRGDAGGALLSPGGDEYLLPLGDEIHVWTISSGKRRAVLPGKDASFSPDGARIVVSDGDYSLVVYDVQSLKPAHTVTTLCGKPRHPQWGPDSNGLYYSVNGRIHGVDVKIGKDLLRGLR